MNFEVYVTFCGTNLGYTLDDLVAMLIQSLLYFTFVFIHIINLSMVLIMYAIHNDKINITLGT